MSPTIDGLETVDDLVNSIIEDYNYDRGHTHMYAYILNCRPRQLLHILESDLNKPSVHDINIIDHIMKIIGTDINTYEFRDCYTMILTAYRDRKV